ncbi:hypothetical protein D3C81_212930 [compost metagenome]
MTNPALATKSKPVDGLGPGTCQSVVYGTPSKQSSSAVLDQSRREPGLFLISLPALADRMLICHFLEGDRGVLAVLGQAQ